MNEKRKIKARVAGSLTVTAVMLVAAIVLFASIKSIAHEWREDEAAQRENEILRELARSQMQQSDALGTVTKERESVNFDALFAVNPNVVGWIYLSGSAIDYPIVQGRDNIHYLYHAFSGAQNTSGAIFLDYRDNPDFSGQARIYGHNVRNGTKFGFLANWSGYDIVIHTPDAKLRYTVIWRGILHISEVVGLSDAGLMLITCVRATPEVRYVVIGERRHIDV